MQQRSPTFLAALLVASGTLGHALLAQTGLQQIPAGRPIKPPPRPATDRIVAGLSSPVFATHVPGDSNRLFIVEQVTAEIMILDLTNNTLIGTPFLDIDSRVTSNGGEQGLLGLAFHPDYANNGLFYVNYNRTADGDTVIAEYQVTGNPDVADFNSERILLTIDQPQSNHNGGWLDFSPIDGYLYIAMGDGGNFCDTGTGHTAGTGNAQDITSNLLGKMLRIDPLGGLPYSVPASNPFVGVTGDDEIWAYGLRNPWRSSFDRLTGDLYIGDVGQDLREEVDYQPASSMGGENYGWRCQEGTLCSTQSPSSCPATTGCNCPAPTMGLIPPVHEYINGAATCAITGGYVYRGSAIGSIQGHYLLADFCSDSIWSFRIVNGVRTDFQNLTSELSPSVDGFSVANISSFGEDADGEMYICDLNGELFKIVPQP